MIVVLRPSDLSNPKKRPLLTNIEIIKDPKFIENLKRDDVILYMSKTKTVVTQREKGEENDYTPQLRTPRSRQDT